LPEQQRNVISNRYGLWDGISETLQGIGSKLGLSRERIRQIESKCLRQLRRSEVGIGSIRNFVLAKRTACLASDCGTLGGILGEDEIAKGFADDCTLDEAMLAIGLMQDVNANLFGTHLIKVERGVYCIDKSVSRSYRELLKTLQIVLRRHQKPISEEEIHQELDGRANSATENQGILVARLIQVSPSVVRLRNGLVGLSEWTKFRGRDAISLAESTLRLLGRPTHFREITQNIGVLCPDVGAVNERTVQAALLRDQKKFVWVKHGTYGLSVWGIKKPPFIRDRLVELLSDARSPLPFSLLKEKVLEECNCKDVSVRMTLDLNPRLFRKFEGDQYALIAR
jgi:hypothetical protein